MNWIRNSKLFSKKYILMGSFSLLLFLLMLFLGLGLSATGLGIESQRFINSVDDAIDVYIPKDQVVISGESSFYSSLVTASLKLAYEQDVLSTLSLEQQNSLEVSTFYSDYADDEFESQWGEKINNKEDIDINEFSHALVQFDIKVAKKFHNYGLTHSGISWIGKTGASSLLSSNYTKSSIYQELIKNQTVLDQSSYNNNLNNNIGVDTYLVNNKIWFINSQIKTLFALKGLGLYRDEEAVVNALTSKEDETKPAQMTVDDVYHPTYTKAFFQTRVGTVFLVILTPIFGLVLLSSIISYFYFKNEKKK